MRLICHVESGCIPGKPVSGVVENISRGGILMSWDENSPAPAFGSSLVVEVNLPENLEFGSRVLRCTTSVVRVVDRPGQPPMIALKIDQIRIADGASDHKIDFLAMPSASERVN